MKDKREKMRIFSETAKAKSASVGISKTYDHFEQI